uniref:CSON005264 protein n=1 Tax=Culicoides sonorensis TaxID=179676 RepID=A0A336K270_CULSO
MNSEISFDYPEPKPNGNYVIPSLDLHDGTFLFSYVSAFLSYVTPQELPVEILRDSVNARVSILHLVLEALKVESGFIGLMALFLITSLIPLAYTIAWGCSRTHDAGGNNIQGDDNVMNNLVSVESSALKSLECKRKFLVVSLQIILIIFVFCVIIMFVTNEQASAAIEKTPILIRSALKDLESFLKDIHHQVIFTIFEGLNTVSDRIKIDLEDIDKLLADPIQHKLLEDTGLDAIFESLFDICTNSNNLSHRIYLLQDTLNRAAAIVSEVESRLDEISIQLSVIKKQCVYRDRPLCDTLNLKNMDESGLNLKFKKLRTDVLLNKLKSMGDMENESILKNLTLETQHAKSSFKIYSTLVVKDTKYNQEAFAAIVLTIFIFVEMIVGGQTELFVCRTFYEVPNYTMLSKLVDKPGLLFLNEQSNGILSEILKTPEYSYVQAAANVSISQALNECENGKSAYTTFDLDSLLNISTSLDFRNYDSLNSAVDKIIASEKNFLNITQTLQNYLHQMIIDSEVNLTFHRMELVQLTPEKDMITFIDQMQRVSLQIQDAATSGRMTTLGARAKRLQLTLLQPLEHLRAEIVYHLTALELQIKPWAQQVNKNLNQLKNAQIYLDNETANICKNATDSYQNRLKMHLNYYRNHTMSVIDGGFGSCRPLFDIFDAIRQLFCRHIVDSINGLWFLTFIFVVLLVISTPVSAILSTVFKKINEKNKILKRTSSSYVGADEQIVISQQSNWASRSNIAADIDRSNW